MNYGQFLPRFIIIDDDELNNKICTISIQKALKHADIKSFTDPVAGFEYIAHEYSKTDNYDTAILAPARSRLCR